MAKIKLILAGLFIFGSVSCAFAQKNSWQELEIGSEFSFIAYKEPGVMEQQGAMSGFSGSLTNYGEYIFRAEGKIGYANMDYQSRNTGDMDNIDDYLLEVRGIAGGELKEVEEIRIIPYLGIGFRYLSDDSQGMTTNTGALGYKREANYYYIPIGLEISSWEAGDKGIRVFLEFDYFIKGVQKSYLSGAVLAFNDPENSQNEGYGYRASVRFRKKTADLDFVFEPFFRCWRIEQSESTDITYSGVIIGFGYEPKNISTEYGLKMSMVF
ncbi:MAG: hypothetical protein HY810_04920 [Candidatus Omnitrophica bacterium]|nr:hypothetical protein [Candidatus Omnitrophota bacterium]